MAKGQKINQPLTPFTPQFATPPPILHSFAFPLNRGYTAFRGVVCTLDNKVSKWYIMPLMKRAKLVRYIKVKEDNGNIMEAKMWQGEPSPDKPHGYKYSLVYIVKGNRVIGYDNSEGKGDHRHYGDKLEAYQFKDLRGLTEDFYQDIERYKEGKL